MPQYMFSAVQFGRDIRDRRRRLGFTQEEIGQFIGVTRSSIWGWENASHGGILIGNLLSLCELFDLDPREYFIDVTEDADALTGGDENVPF